MTRTSRNADSIREIAEPASSITNSRTTFDDRLHEIYEEASK